ncbi:MAG: GNAT family N-acetyltransferase [Caldilineaceae bacterium]
MAYGELKRMYVRPQFRGLGLGTRLLEHLADYARNRGVHVLRLETEIHQTAAIRMCERWGFMQISPFGAYKVDPLEACSMRGGWTERIPGIGERDVGGAAVACRRCSKPV